MSPRHSLALRVARLREDDGLTLIEAVVSMLVAALMLAGLGASLVATARAGTTARFNQQAGDLLNQQLETVRDLPYSSLTMISSQLSTADPYLTYSGGSWTFNPGTGAETIASSTVGSATINPYTRTIVRNNQTYTVRTYVTCPAATPTCVGGSGAQSRRVTVVVTWSDHGKAKERRESTIVTDTRRGLPLPYFKFGPKSLVNANMGGPITIPVRLTNLGARDAWNLTATGTGWKWYADVNCDGVLQTSGSTTDTLMTGNSLYDIDINGVVDTGMIEAGTTMCLLVSRTATSGDVGTTTVSLTAVSVAQPAASTASKTVNDTIQTSSDFCYNCVSTLYYLHNAVPNVGNTTSKTSDPLPMDITACTTCTTLYNYSTDLSTSAGRYVTHGGSGDSENDLGKLARWQRQCKTGTSIVVDPTTNLGYASVTLYVQPAPGPNNPGSYTVTVGKTKKSGNTQQFTSDGSTTFTKTNWSNGGFGNWTQVTVSVPVGPLTVQNNEYLEVRVEVPSSSNDMIFAYDTTTFVAQTKIPLATAC